MELHKNTGMNKHTIDLINGKQLLYKPIYIFSLVELATLKIYIKTHLKTGFIRPFKSSASALILFNNKFNTSLCLCVNY